MNKCLIGACLIEFSLGFFVIWGKVNIYFYSYFKHFQPDLPYNYNFIIGSIIAIPMVLSSLVSLKLASYFGYKKFLVFMGFAQFLSLYISSFMETYEAFLFFYGFVNANIFMLQFYPVMKCVWSHYKGQEAKASGISFGAFNGSVFFFILFMTFLINPDNKKAELQVKYQGESFPYFEFSVVKNVPYILQFIAFFTGTVSIIGATLISFKQSESVGGDLELEEIKQEDQINQKSKQEQKDMKSQIFDAIKTRSFWILFLNKCSLTIFLVLLGQNFKFYTMTKINDDRFITLVETSSVLLGIPFTIFIGCIADKYNFKWCISGLFLTIGVMAFIFPVVSNFGKILFSLSQHLNLLMIDLFDKGSLVLLGPALMRLYNKELGAQLFPYINSGGKLAIFFVPIIQIIGERYLSLDSLLMLTGVGVFSTAILLPFLQLNREIVN